LLSSNLGRWWNWWICLLSSAILGYSRDPKWSHKLLVKLKTIETCNDVLLRPIRFSRKMCL
jgi:hypothetical protein